VWQWLVDTAAPDRPSPDDVLTGGEHYPLYGRSLALLRAVHIDEAEQTAAATQYQSTRKQTGEQKPQPATV
jgi:hypothetical protein